MSHIEASLLKNQKTKLSNFPGKNTRNKPTKQHENIISQINSILSKVDLKKICSLWFSVYPWS